MKRERLNFTGSHGAQLAGHLDSPDVTPTAYAILCHCFTCSAHLKSAGWISRALVEQGIAVLRFDFTGLGESEGDFAETDFSSNLDDLVAAADFLRREREAPRLLVGHSLGGTAVLAAAHRIPETAAIATIGSPSDTEHLRDKLVGLAPELEARGEAAIDLGGLRPIRIRRELLDDLAADHLRNHLASLHKPLLLFHSPVDNVVGIEHAHRLFEMARHPKSFVSLGLADHLLTNERDARHAGEVLGVWARHYVEGVQPEVEVETEAGKVGRVVVTEVSGFAQTIRARKHRLTADEPLELNGTDTGPNPYELLLAALGACTSMTLRVYANHKQLPLERVRVTLEHSKIHALDCAACETKEGKLDQIDRVIELIGPLTEEQRKRLLEIANRCPVHRTLESEIHVPTRLA